jgi:hypothetical protein
LVYPWVHPDPGVDHLAKKVFQLVNQLQKQNESRAGIFAKIWELVCTEPLPAMSPVHAVPHLDEPWYCCAEPIPQV